MKDKASSPTYVTGHGYGLRTTSFDDAESRVRPMLTRICKMGQISLMNRLRWERGEGLLFCLFNQSSQLTVNMGEEGVEDRREDGGSDLKSLQG
jgi:hypothetical protein